VGPLCPPTETPIMPFATLLLTLLSPCTAWGAEEVLVEAEQQLEQEVPFAVTELHVDERLPANADLGSLLDRAPGTQIRRFGGLGSYTTIGIRGSSTRQVQVFLDGIPLNADGSATVNLAEWPLHAFSTVEVFRGNLPIHFAAAPIGGAVNLVSKKAPPRASARIAGGQLQTWRLNAMSFEQTEDSDGLLLIDGFRSDSNYHYFDDNGTPYNRMDDGIRRRQNNHSQQLGGLGRWRLRAGDVTLSLLDVPMTRAQGLAGHTNTPADKARLHTDRNLLVSRVQHTGEDLDTDTQVWHLIRRDRYDDRAGELGAGSQWSAQTTQGIGLLHNSTWMAHPRAQLQGTLAARRDWFKATDLLTGTAPSSPRRDTLSLSAAAAWWPIPEHLYLYPALNVELLSANLEQAISGGSSAHPRLAVAAFPTTGLMLKANTGHFFRPPDYFELFGDRGSIVGNSQLRPERSWQSDLGLRVSSPLGGLLQLSVESVGFLNLFTDQIIYVQNAQRSMVPVNLNRSFLSGLEGSLDLALLDRWDLQGSFTYTHAVNRSPDEAVFGKRLPNIPRLDLSVLSSITWEDWVRLGVQWTFVDRTFWDATNWYPAAPRNHLGFFARASLPAQGLSLELDWMNLSNNLVQVSDRNPLDAADPSQIVTAITDFSGYPLPGRTWLVQIAWRPPHAD
jgi:outer membrane receptor protein involved in Fe transport